MGCWALEVRAPATHTESIPNVRVIERQEPITRTSACYRRVHTQWPSFQAQVCS